MSLTWKDALATVLVSAGALLYLLWMGGTTLAGLSGPRALAMAIFVLGAGGCSTAKSNMEAMYGAGDRPRPPLRYVVTASAVGAFTLVAAVVAMLGGAAGALATLTVAMVAMWAMATIRHWGADTTPEVSATMR